MTDAELEDEVRTLVRGAVAGGTDPGDAADVLAAVEDDLRTMDEVGL